MAFTAGTRLGPYVVRAFLSAGGMGEVYRAHDPRLNREVAIKVLPPQLAELAEFRRRFDSETQAISRLNHKNICTIYDTGTHEDRPYIVMELLEGRSLDALTKGGPLEMDRVVHIGIQIANALDAAHGGGVIHRDVKSANIFLNHRGDVKVLDFGIAKVRRADEEAEETRTTGIGIPVGTVAYMSPEQARGEDVDARSDIFSLGVVLYEMATGATPYPGTTSSILAQLVSPDPVPDPRTLNPTIPQELGRIVCRALEKDRGMRYQTAADLLAALRGLRRDLTTVSTKPAPRDARAAATWRTPRRTLPWVIGAVAVVTAVLLGRGLLSSGPLADRPVRSIAVLPCGRAGEGAGVDYVCDLIAERIITSLSAVPGFTTVLSYQAVEPYAGDDRGAIRVGQDLGVDAVLTALVREQGGELNVTVELTDVRTGALLWGRPYQRPADEAQTLHEDIAEDVTESLQLRLTARDRERIRLVETYQQAQYYLDDRTASSLEKAVGRFEEVIAADSTFARAYAGLASSYILLHYYAGLSPEESYPRAREAAERALELDESLADAHASLGLVNRDFDRDFEEAEREFRRALDLDPRSTSALQWYAELLTVLGRFDEAEARILEAEASARLNRTVRAVHGWILTGAGRYAEAETQLLATLELDPDFALTNWFLGQLHFARGDYAAAVETLLRATEFSGGSSRMRADLASATARAGDPTAARGILADLEATAAAAGSTISRYEAAIVHAGLGETDVALAELEASLDERTWQVVNMGVDPMLGALRSSPRFQGLLRRVRLPGS